MVYGDIVQLIETGRLGQAARTLRDHLARAPADAAAWALLGTVNRRRRHHTAEADLLRALTLDPAEARALLQLGILRRRDRRPAAAWLGRGRQLVPAHRELLYQEALALGAEGAPDRALARLRHLWRHRPTLGRLAVDIADQYRALGTPLRAARALAAGRVISPDHPAVIAAHARAFGNHPAEAARLAMAVTLDPTLADAHERLGDLMFARGDRIGAREAYDRAARHGDNLADLYLKLGRCWQADDIEVALNCYRNVLDRRPNDIAAHRALAEAEAARGQPDRAAHHRRLIRLIDPGNRAAGMPPDPGQPADHQSPPPSAIDPDRQPPPHR